MALLLELIWRFFQVGLFSVGGGLATLPFLYEMSQVTGWFSHKDISDMIAISQSTPGPIGVNMSTYVGYLVADVSGAIAATLALVLPSLIIIVAISQILTTFKESRLVKDLFSGLRPASAALILASGLGVAQETFFRGNGRALALDYKSAGLAMGILYISQKKKVHPILLIFLSAIIGMILQMK